VTGIAASQVMDSDAIELELVEAAPEEVDAGAGFSLTVRVTSPAGLNLGNAPFLIAAASEVRSRGALPDRGGEGHVVRIALTAPEEIGEFTWQFVIPAHATDGKAWREASLPFSFRTKPHVTSLAVWDYPSPVVIGTTFKLKVGAQCSSGCTSLQGHEIEIRDAADAVVARAALGATPWPETNALYWTEVDLTAPGTAGHHAWTVKFSSAASGAPHGAASFAFSLIADRPPEHTVTVEIIEEHTATPIDDAHVRLGVYRTFTDETGLARLAVPDGEHELSIWKTGYNAPARMLNVESDARILVEAELLPTINPDSYWQG
jgi:hypothetical protein